MKRFGHFAWQNLANSNLEESILKLLALLLRELRLTVEVEAASSRFSNVKIHFSLMFVKCLDIRHPLSLFLQVWTLRIANMCASNGWCMHYDEKQTQKAACSSSVVLVERHQNMQCHLCEAILLVSMHFITLHVFSIRCTLLMSMIVICRLFLLIRCFRQCAYQQTMDNVCWRAVISHGSSSWSLK